LPDAPTCTVPPVIQELDGHKVGDTLALTIGTWTGAPTFAYQWTRGGGAIPPANTRVYVIAPEDVGLMIGAMTTATNMGGSLSVDSVPIGPVTEAARKRK
jgi:hypothetical protein